MMNFPKKTIVINNMRRVEDYLGCNPREDDGLRFLELRRNIGVSGVKELLELIPEGFDREKMQKFYEETGLRILVEVHNDNCELTMYDKDGRYPREDAALWNRDFVRNLSEHPEWLEPQEEPDILVRYIYPLKNQEDIPMERKMETPLYITNVKEFLKLEEPERFDFKRLMPGYYNTKDIKMPYAEVGQSRLINFLKYKTGDIKPFRPFDCDGSNGTCELSIEMWQTLLPWRKTDRRVHTKEVYGRLTELEFGPDTMHTAATSLDDYMQGRLGRKCSVWDIKELIDLEKAGEDRNGEISTEELLEEIFGELTEASGTIGDFVLVPYRFNGKRYSFTKDYWDLSLSLLKNCTEEKLNELLGSSARYTVAWDRKLFALYINMMFLWEDVEVKRTEQPEKKGRMAGTEIAIRPLWKFNRELLQKEELTKESFRMICEIRKTDEDYRMYSHEAAGRSVRRAVFMAAMLKLALGEDGRKYSENTDSAWKVSGFYKKVVGKILLNPVEIYSGFEDVLRRIMRLAEEENAVDFAAPVIDRALEKLSGLK